MMPPMNQPLIRILLCLVCAAPILSRADHVIFISADGMRPDAVDVLGEAGAPNFYRLRREGSHTSNARTDVTYTITLPNHTCMITGRGVVGPKGHEWISNTDPKLGQNLHRNHKSYVRSFFDVAHDHGLSTALYASKSKFSLYDLSYDANNGEPDTTEADNGRDKIDLYVVNEDTAPLVDLLVASFSEKPADVTMLHLRNCDSAGHALTWDLTPDSPYLAALKEVDGLLGKLLAGIEASPQMKGNTWVLLTADHGGLTGTKGHGEANEANNYTIAFYAWGPGVPAGGDLYALNAASRQDPGKLQPGYDAPKPPIRNGDAANLILSLMKLPAVPDSTINAGQDLKVTQ